MHIGVRDLPLRDMISLGAWRMGLGCSGKILPSPSPPPSSPSPTQIWKMATSRVLLRNRSIGSARIDASRRAVAEGYMYVKQIHIKLLCFEQSPPWKCMSRLMEVALNVFILHWIHTDCALNLHWNSIDIWLGLHWNLIESALKLNCICIEFALKLHWHMIDFALKSHWICIEVELLLHWICIDIWLNLHWNLIEFALKLNCMCIDFAVSLHRHLI